MNYYNAELEDAVDYLTEALGREPTDEEIQEYLDELEALAQDNYYSSIEDEQQGN